MKTNQLVKPVIFRPAFRPPTAILTPQPLPKIVTEWQFPLGENVATLRIVGGKIQVEDMDTLLEFGKIFRSQIARQDSEVKAEPDYSI